MMESNKINQAVLMTASEIVQLIYDLYALHNRFDDIISEHAPDLGQALPDQLDHFFNHVGSAGEIAANTLSMLLASEAAGIEFEKDSDGDYSIIHEKDTLRKRK